MQKKPEIYNPFEKYDNGILLRRWLATAIDYFILILVLIAFVFIREEMKSDFIPWIGFLVCTTYFIVLEGYWGITVGKLAAGIRVVGLDAGPPGIWRATVRTLTRLLEVNPVLLGALPAGLIVLSGQSKQRLGDILAHTHVWRVQDVQLVRKMLYAPQTANEPVSDMNINESNV